MKKFFPLILLLLIPINCTFDPPFKPDDFQPFYSFMDAHWSKDRYHQWRNWLSNSGIMDELFLWIMDSSALLPHDSVFLEFAASNDPYDRHEYYRMMFKYEQFIPGWDDAWPHKSSQTSYFNPSYADNPYLDTLDSGHHGFFSPFYDTLAKEIVPIIYDGYSGAVDTMVWIIRPNVWFGTSQNRKKASEIYFNIVEEKY